MGMGMQFDMSGGHPNHVFRDIRLKLKYPGDNCEHSGNNIQASYCNEYIHNKTLSTFPSCTAYFPQLYCLPAPSVLPTFPLLYCLPAPAVHQGCLRSGLAGSWLASRRTALPSQPRCLP